MMNELDLREKFNSISSELNLWGAKVDSVLNSFVSSRYVSTIELVQFKAQHRVKDAVSFIQKALYRNKNYENPMVDITDKVGTRLVLLCSKTVTEVSEFIKSRNGIDWIVVEHAKEISKIKEAFPEQFNYQSEHYIVKPCAGYSALVDVDYLTCEIQVRTILQHAYSEVSHAFVYKQNKDIDKIVRRKLAAAMAFLEEADEKFLYIYDKHMDEMTLDMKIVNKLNKEFAKLNPNYQVSMFDREVMDVYMRLLDLEKKQLVYDTISEFIKVHDDEMKNAFCKYNRYYLFTQPVSLLAFYSLEKWKNFTKENWPYKYETLKLIVAVLGYSDDVL